MRTTFRKPLIRAAVASIGLGAVTLLAGCSQEELAQWSRVGYREATSDRAAYMGELWTGTWIAAMVVGVFVWGLMFWAAIRYRRRREGITPRQSKYNLPLELLYTLVPFLIIGVLFFFTVRTQDKVAEKSPNPDVVINVIGQKWSWTFNYMEENKIGAVVHEVGTIEKTPDLYLPVNKKVRFNLNSADVIHSFWIPTFYYKLDVIPGKTDNSFEVTPTKEGVFAGKCAELCGTYHSAMLFNVHIVSEAKYLEYLQGLKAKGQTGEIKLPAYPTAIPTPGAKETHE